MDNTALYLASVILNKKSWRAFLGGNRLVIPEATVNGRKEFFDSTRTFRLTEKYLKQWNNFLKSEKINTTLPYSFHWPAMMKFYIRELLYNLKVNNTRVLHIGHEAEVKGTYSFSRDSIYKNRNMLKDIHLLRKGSVVLVTESVVEDTSGNFVFHAADYFHVSDIPENDMRSLSSSEFCDRTPLKFFNKGFGRREQTFKDGGKGYRTINHYFPGNMCLRFGILSGAISLHHQFRLPTRLIYHEMPYLQGMCTGNVIFKLLADELNRDIKKINIYFNNKMYFPGSIELRFNNKHYEVYDERKVMVAFGSVNINP